MGMTMTHNNKWYRRMNVSVARPPMTKSKNTESISTELLTHRGATDPEGSRFTLIAYHRDGAKVLTLEPGKRVVVGRTPPADLVVPDGSLSRQHARFGVVGDQIVVDDLGSTNGTWLAGKAIESETIRPGEVVVLGSVRVLVQAVGGRPRLGLEGHDHFLAQLEREMERSRHFKRSVSLLMMRAADRDTPLHEWAQRVSGVLRSVDTIALYGGDTVEALLLETDESEARRVAAKVQQAVAATALRFGVAAFPDAGITVEQLVAAARGALQSTTASHTVARAPSAMVAQPEPLSKSGVVAESQGMVELLDMAKRVARGNIPVLLHGETGTGKEVLAHYIHDKGPRKAKPLVTVNCAAIPPQLVESTLFGHVKGAFTGADQARAGVFEAAGGGTVLLDEVGELPAAAQAALLRVLESKQITRVGSTKEVDVDVRIVAASHRNLEEMVRDGSFREDLLYRLNAVTLEIPALRERKEDILPLVGHFLAVANEANGTRLSGLEPEVEELLQSYAWPGNIRELRNVVERAVVIAEHDLIGSADLPQRIVAGEVPAARNEKGGGWDSVTSVRERGETFRACIERLEAQIILEALEETRGNQAEAARRLEMPRRTLVHKIKVLGLRREDY